MDMKKKKLTEKDANRSFFRLVKSFNTPEKPQTPDVCSLRPGKRLNKWRRNSRTSLTAYHRHSIHYMVARSRPPVIGSSRCCHPRKCPSESSILGSQSRWSWGGVFPELMSKFHDFFAIPLLSIFNEIGHTFVWPDLWKTEYVMIIPKNSCPASYFLHNVAKQDNGILCIGVGLPGSHHQVQSVRGSQRLRELPSHNQGPTENYVQPGGSESCNCTYLNRLCQGF